MSSLRHSTTAGRQFLRGLGCALLALASGALLAHHSYSMFDFQKPKSLDGTVRDFQWSNPHSFIGLEVPGAPGTKTRYVIETQSPSVLMRLGWKFNTIKMGDKVKIVMFPLRDGRAGGALYSIELADGKTLKSTFSEEFLKSGKVDVGHR